MTGVAVAGRFTVSRMFCFLFFLLAFSFFLAGLACFVLVPATSPWRAATATAPIATASEVPWAVGIPQVRPHHRGRSHPVVAVRKSSLRAYEPIRRTRPVPPARRHRDVAPRR